MTEIQGKSEINFCESQCEVQVSEGLSYRESNVGKTQDAAANQESMLLDFS